MAHRIHLGRTLPVQTSTAAPKDAATVMLLRGGAHGAPEVFMLRRTPRMAFAPGAHVFPGGSVDPQDANADIGWSGPPPEAFADAFGVPADRARGLVVAAVRETFEECGVLLAGSGTSQDRDEADRQALASGQLSLAELLNQREATLRADLLTPWARWVTPEIDRRRFDAFFFVAALPYGQIADAGIRGNGESDEGGWFAPTAALDAARAGSALLMPPTAVSLAELAAGGEIADILAQEREIRPLCPQVVQDDEGSWLVMPEGVEYPL